MPSSPSTSISSSSSSSSTSYLPLVPCSVKERVFVEMKAMDHPLSLMQIRHLGDRFVSLLTPSIQEAVAVEKITRRQYACKRWHAERFSRLTSSKFGEICKCKEPVKLCTRLLYKGASSSLSSSSLLWGRDHEDTARDEYVKTVAQPKGWKVQECGLFLSTRIGYLGTSPDGLVSSDGKVIGCIEIKCPFSAQDKTVVEACATIQQFFCTMDENRKVHLKKRHNYYYQVQGQLALLNLQWCDFVVWTRSGIHVERITFDRDFWSKQCLPQLKSFYTDVILPEIVYPRHPLTILNYSTF